MRSTYERTKTRIHPLDIDCERLVLLVHADTVRSQVSIFVLGAVDHLMDLFPTFNTHCRRHFAIVGMSSLVRQNGVLGWNDVRCLTHVRSGSKPRGEHTRPSQWQDTGRHQLVLRRHCHLTGTLAIGDKGIIGVDGKRQAVHRRVDNASVATITALQWTIVNWIVVAVCRRCVIAFDIGVVAAETHVTIPTSFVTHYSICFRLFSIDTL